MAVRLTLERIFEQARTGGGRPAVIFEKRVMTYRQLLALVSVAARMYHDSGVRPGDVAGVAMAHSPLYLVAILALARIGAVSLPQYPNVPAADRKRALERYGARWLVAPSADTPNAGARLIVMRDLSARGKEDDFGFTSFVPNAETPLRIALTSGTTGTQKALLHTHGALATRMSRRFAAADELPRVMPPLLHITSALQLALHALAEGGTVVFPPPNDARGFIEAINLHAVTHVQLPPADVALMLSLLPDDSPVFPSLRHLKMVGATPSAALVRLARRKVSPHVFASYSMTETGMVASADADFLESHPGMAGRVAAGARVEAIGEDGRALPPGERGELRVATEGMPQAYYGPDIALPGFRDGWFHPGDHGYVTAEGNVHVEGRRDSLLNIGGHKIAPEFVESILGDRKGVLAVAAFATDDELAGKRVAAAIVAGADLDWKALRAHAMQSLGQGAPARYFRIDSLPRNDMGKLRRDELARWVAEHGQPVDQ